MARFISHLRGSSEIRADLVDRVKMQLNSGQYLADPARTDAALNELIRDLSEPSVSWDHDDKNASTEHQVALPTNDEGRAPEAELRIKSTDIEPSVLVADMVHQLIPRLQDDHVAALAHAIERARDCPPRDKDGFVKNVNRLFDVFNLRLKAEDGCLYRLRTTPGASGEGFIQLTGGGSQKRRGFKKGRLELVTVPTNYLGSHKDQEKE